MLKLLHEALNRSGDHYSIEYGGSHQKSLGSFKRQLHSNDSSGSSTLEAVMLDGFLSSPSKRRRHSDSNVTLVLPTPRGNMKGSLSLEGEARCDQLASESNCSTNCNDESNSGKGMISPPLTPSLEWNDPYSISPPISLSASAKHYSLRKSSPDETSSKTRMAVHVIDRGTESENSVTDRNVIIVKGPSPAHSPSTSPSSTSPSSTSPSIHRTLSRTSSKQSNDGSGGRTANNYVSCREMSVDEDPENSSVFSCVLKTESSQDSVELASVFSEDADANAPCTEVEGERSASVAGVAGESSIKTSRRRWYNHKYFSTPVHDGPGFSPPQVKGYFGPRSSSLPLPDPERGCLISPDFFPSPDADSRLPLITVSSPSDQASEGQVKKFFMP